MRWFQATLFGLAVLSIEAQPHLGRCPELNVPPPSNHDGCSWVVVADFRGCRTYVEECGKPNKCTREWEVLWKCSSECPPTCAEKWPGCGEQCGPPRCQCVGGYVRDYSGNCIKIFECPTQHRASNDDNLMLDASQQLKQPKAHLCSVNEEYVACSSMCEPTCTSPPNQPCPAGCGPPKCQCRSGFVRHGGRCITRNQCPASDECL
ncbi:hypothetical protein Tcan_09232 [Toxocara canis]|uniref:TIL domain-containing protein n=1 Tax=Toxocara canis TaxID=6265 RepID=A0A0B2VRY4_TOXCA|nr:hypothetical protein Tcan_09232 [Toxocara canis]